MITRLIAVAALAIAGFAALGGREPSQTDADRVVHNGTQRMDSILNQDTHDMISSRLQDSTQAGKDFAGNFGALVP